MTNVVTMPTLPVSQEDLNTWYVLQEKLDQLKAQEMELRKKIFGAFFANPREGTNTAPLSDGWVLKGQHIIRRDVDVEALTTLGSNLREHGVPVDSLIKYKPELVTANYRQLTDEQRHLFDQCLVIKIGSPQLEITLPKRAAKTK